MKIIGIIPARYQSTRFPGKVLVDIKGKSMVQRVYEQASKSTLLSKVIIATESEEVRAHVKSFGGEAVLTNDNHASGTDRCFEALTLQKETYDYVVNIQGDDLSFLIGYRGESINALQSLLGLILFNKLGDHVNLVVDINDYRSSRKDKIEEITKNYIDRARFSGQAVEMPFMNPYERRQVHLFVSGYDDIESESTGEGRFRRVVLRTIS